ncbi:hypothetical protein SAMN04515618_12713 [Collimonas sp. OK307]|nr:hypothetical protein [Collimonas sp. OK307]SFI46744.1 hypothetical protein SAMN04515618_12713 [Collimonas sp. OK307]
MLIITGCITLITLAIAGLTAWRLIRLTGQSLPDCNDDFIFF